MRPFPCLLLIFWISLAASLVPARGIAQSVFDSLYVLRSAEVYFPSGEATLLSESGPALDSLAAFFQNTPRSRFIRITAHADSVGTAARNLTLSQRRSATVCQALTRRGIPADRIEIAFYGENRPAAANATEPGRQRNRRATLDLIGVVPMADFTGQVTDKSTNQGVPATVFFTTKTRRDSVETDTSGRYAVRLPKDSVVKIEAYAAGYFFQNMMQRIYGTPEMIARMRKSPPVLSLTPAKPGAIATLHNLYFVGNQAVLLRTSQPELPKVLKFMQVNPGLHIELAGHINQPGVPSIRLAPSEWELSTARAKTVYDYLVENGIPAEQLTYKGYGNSEMLFPYPGATAEQQEQNRRVEIRVLGE